MKRYITITAAASALAAGLLTITIVAAAPEEVAGQPVAAPADTTLPSPEPHVDGDSIIHIPGPPGGPSDPACQALAEQRAAARAAGVPTIKIPTELMSCTPGAMG